MPCRGAPPPPQVAVSVGTPCFGARVTAQSVLAAWLTAALLSRAHAGPWQQRQACARARSRWQRQCQPLGDRSPSRPLWPPAISVRLCRVGGGGWSQLVAAGCVAGRGRAGACCVGQGLGQEPG